MARPAENYLIMQLRYKKQIPLEIVTGKKETEEKANDYALKKSGTVIFFPVVIVEPKTKNDFTRPGFWEAK